MLDENEHLQGKEYKGKEISCLVILQKDADLSSIGEAARRCIRDGNSQPQLHLKDYEVYLLFDLNDWLPAQLPLDWMLLTSYQKKMNQ